MSIEAGNVAPVYGGGTPYRHITDEHRREAIQRVLTGDKPASVALSLGVEEKSVRRWLSWAGYAPKTVWVRTGVRRGV